MSARFIPRSILAGVIGGVLGGGDGLGCASQARAQSMTAATYNVQVAGFGGGLDEWINTRRHLVFESIVANQPDFMGFQEAFARASNSQGVTQQSALGQLFEGTQWRYFSWEAQNVFNMNPFIVNTDRFLPVDSGSTTIDIEQFLGPQGWQEFFDLHTFFHGDPNTGRAHFLGPERYLNWVVADDIVGGGRVAFLTSHYETFIGVNRRGPEYDVLFARFSEIVNASFGYLSREIVAQAELLESTWGDLEVIVGGDFETPDPELPAQKEFTNAGYVETWRFINGGGRRPTQGIDNLFVTPEGLTINSSHYDQAPYTNGASDHKPLYANVTQSSSLCYPDCDGSGILDIFDFLCFQNSFVSGEPYACHCDPDPACDIFDFLCFQNAFVGGCP